jgi:hypothetical protein
MNSLTVPELRSTVPESYGFQPVYFSKLCTDSLTAGGPCTGQYRTHIDRNYCVKHCLLAPYSNIQNSIHFLQQFFVSPKWYPTRTNAFYKNSYSARHIFNRKKMLEAQSEEIIYKLLVPNWVGESIQQHPSPLPFSSFSSFPPPLRRRGIEVSPDGTRSVVKNWSPPRINPRGKWVAVRKPLVQPHPFVTLAIINLINTAKKL